MKKHLTHTVCMCAALLFLSVTVNAQTDDSKRTKRVENSSNPVVVIAGTAAKAAWVTTKFVAKDVASPVGKAIFLKAVPKLTVYALKTTPKLAARLLPTAMKLAVL